MWLAARGAAAEPAVVDPPPIDDAELLKQSEAEAETIEIHGDAPAVAQGAASLSRTDLERLPGAGNDVIRALDAMPGVVAYPLPLGDAGIAIRGGSPQDSKILVDGFEIPMLYHNIGFRSIIPAEAIDQIDYIPGGFDVAYGRASSGIVNLTTRAGGESHQQAEVSSSDAGAIAQGTFDRGAYLIAVRRSVIDQLLPAVLPKDLDLSLTTVPRYYDEQLRLDYKASPSWDLRLSSVGSDDVLALYTSSTASPTTRLYDRTRFARVTAAAHYHADGWNADLALSGIDQQTVYERGTAQHLTITTPGVNARAEISRGFDDAGVFRHAVWRIGSELAASHNDIALALPQDHREGQPPAVDDPMDTSARFTGGVWTPDSAAWTSISGELHPRIHLTAGVRVDDFERGHDTVIEPRGELALQLSPTVVARFSAGEYTRPPEFQTELLTPTLGPEHATQLVSGVAFAPREGIKVQGSLYYTDRSHLITQVGDQLGNTGTGTTYGAELFATLHDGPWFGWLSYAYSHSTRVDMPSGPSRLFDYDQPHNLNVAASYRWGRFQLGGRFRLYSGLPQTPVHGAVFDSDRNLYAPVYGGVNSERAPMHHELDIRIDRQWHWGPVLMTYFLDIQNVYLNQTPAGYIYSFDYAQRSAYRGLPILPTAGLRAEL